VVIPALLVLGFPSWGQSPPGTGDWYISNASGMALERAGSSFVALRRPYCLLIEEPGSLGLPAPLSPYYREPWTVERRTLYKDGEEFRVQWIFRDAGGGSRLVAVFTPPEDEAGAPEEREAALADSAESADAADSAESGAKVPNGFIELYGENGLIELERQLFDAGEETLVEYRYRRLPSGTRDFLIRADTRRKLTDGEGNAIEEDLYTDYYRYTRNYSLRTIERFFYQGTGTGNTAAMRFPRRSLDSKDEELFVSPAISYGSEFLEDVQTGTPGRLVYETDERGRILKETRWGEDGELVSELRNQWSDNRLSRIIYTTTTPVAGERITEYEYNDEGDRITERNYRDGVLERVVHSSGGREDEEIYMNGELILRTQWEGGRKIREERVRPAPTGTGAAVP
jgi:hypothetical protein